MLATAIDDDYTEYYIGDYLDLGIAALASIDWEFGLSLLAGARYDSIDMESRQPIDKLLLPSSNNFCPAAGRTAWTSRHPPHSMVSPGR